MHESQSRLWENHIGRHRAFTDFMLPHLKERFPEELGMLAPDEFYEGVNHPERTLIRVAADEVTYNLHVALRFELELALFRDELQVADLPDAWNAGMEKHLNVRPENDGEGVLQDMHWPDGYFGYFPTYSLGTLYAAAFFARAQDQLGPLGDELRAGDTDRLLDWMRREVHARAYLYPATELGEMVIGAPLTAEPFLDYIRTKYGELYSLEL
jgi:carboxypeptidase Taq